MLAPDIKCIMERNQRSRRKESFFLTSEAGLCAQWQKTTMEQENQNSSYTYFHVYSLPCNWTCVIGYYKPLLGLACESAVYFNTSLYE